MLGSILQSREFPFFNPKHSFMNKNPKPTGRPRKVNTANYRCVVNLTAAEHNALIAMQEKAKIASLSAFIKMRIFAKPFKVHYIDDNSRSFIDKLSSLHHQYRTVAIDYDLLIKTLRQNFTEKKAMQALYRLEQATISLVKLHRDVINLCAALDDYWKNFDSTGK